jgi:CHASE3 domain sensor protein
MTFKGKLISGLTAATGILLLVAVMSYVSLVRNAADRQWVLHTYQVLGKLDEVRIGMTDAETGERGYILTGDDSYLTPYVRGVAEVHESAAQVRKLTSDNAKQQRALDSLEPVIVTRLGELRERIEVRRGQGLTAGITAVKEGAGNEYMEQLRAGLAGMKADSSRKERWCSGAGLKRQCAKLTRNWSARSRNERRSWRNAQRT